MNRTQVDKVNKNAAPKSGDIFESIHTIMHLFRSAQYRALRGGLHELTHMEGKLLCFFFRNPGATLKDLAGHMKQDKGQLARLIRGLREQGLLRGEDDKTDRRSVRLRLTLEGVRVHKKLRARVERLSTLAVKGLTAGDRSQLTGLLRRIQANLEEA